MVEDFCRALKFAEGGLKKLKDKNNKKTFTIPLQKLLSSRKILLL